MTSFSNYSEFRDLFRNSALYVFWFNADEEPQTISDETRTRLAQRFEEFENNGFSGKFAFAQMDYREYGSFCPECPLPAMVIYNDDEKLKEWQMDEMSIEEVFEDMYEFTRLDLSMI